ncbi:MAG: hypothetical protein A2X42_01355 [Candidatus Margulisbacteria bacterium GWF2_38_17]|nr:MAG: hypothetical protein A2X43_12740 [Candidatus Margulisbacteria bacterium GWD2_39_127]OGI02098.1 MAG: hypothetical protein A2X42_01355 [Candidatus Margulisbacteria bacterium GWF2_38_17]
MKADIINPFVTGALSVLRQLLPSSEIKQGELSIKKEYSFLGEQLIIINFFGDLEGLFIFDMKEETSIKVSEIMNSTVLNLYNGMVTATIKEMANMIAGKAISYLRESGICFDISTPEIITASSFSAPEKITKILHIPIDTKVGRIVINIALSS